MQRTIRFTEIPTLWSEFICYHECNISYLAFAFFICVCVCVCISRLTTKAVAVLLPILGISWIFGVLAVNDHSLLFQYMFAVFNSLQVRNHYCVTQQRCTKDHRSYSNWLIFTSITASKVNSVFAAKQCQLQKIMRHNNVWNDFGPGLTCKNFSRCELERLHNI